jgi:hypothetical protein
MGEILIIIESRCTWVQVGFKIGAFFRYGNFVLPAHFRNQKKSMGLAYGKAWRMCIREFPAGETVCV